MDFKTSHVRTFFSTLSDEGLAYSTIKGFYGLLNPSFELAVEDGIIRKNPVTGTLGDYGAPAKEKEALTLELWEKLLKIVEQSRSEQELLEEEIKDVRDQNSKLQIQVNKSSVEAVDDAQKKQKEAEKKMEQAEAKARNEKKRAEMEIRKTKKEVKARTEKMRDAEYFWGIGYITVILFAIIQNGAFQHDFIDFFRIPFTWYVRFCEWLVYPTYDNGFNQKIAYTGGEAWVIRILAIVAIIFILAIMIVMIVEAIKRYKKMWNEISQMFLIGSLSGITVLGDVTRKYLPVNLILLFILINIGIMLLRIYLRKKFYYM